MADILYPNSISKIQIGGSLYEIYSQVVADELLAQIGDILDLDTTNKETLVDAVNELSARVPAPTVSDANKYLRGDGTWHTVSSGGGTGINREQITVTVPTAASSWTTDATSGAKVYTATNALTTASPTDIWADLDMSSATTSTAEDLLDAWAMIGRIYTDDRNIKVVCYDGIPETSVTIRITAYTL